MYVPWPYPSGLHSGMERGQDGKLLFRGPRYEGSVDPRPFGHITRRWEISYHAWICHPQGFRME